MTTILKAMVIIVMAPLALCVGVYGCTAVHVSAVQHALTQSEPAPVRCTAPLLPTGRPICEPRP